MLMMEIEDQKALEKTKNDNDEDRTGPRNKKPKDNNDEDSTGPRKKPEKILQKANPPERSTKRPNKNDNDGDKQGPKNKIPKKG